MFIKYQICLIISTKMSTRGLIKNQWKVACSVHPSNGDGCTCINNKLSVSRPLMARLPRLFRTRA